MTRPAERAAAAIISNQNPSDLPLHNRCVELIAEIIDRETGLPDLLAACKEIRINTMGSRKLPDTMLARLGAAIAKATGE